MSKMLKRSIALLLTVCALACVLPQVTAAPKAQASGVTTFAAIIVWRYKIENELLWKRQFNTSTQQWIGNWVLA